MGDRGGGGFLQEPVGKTVRSGPGSLIWEAHSPRLARTVNNVLSGNRSNRARPYIKLGRMWVEAQAGLSRWENFPLTWEGVRVVSPMRVSAF